MSLKTPRRACSTEWPFVRKSRQNSSEASLGGAAGLTTPKLARLAGEVKACKNHGDEGLPLVESIRGRDAG
jgi:hypothetical protein